MAELLLAAAFAAGYAGFALLGLSLPRHWREVTGQLAMPARSCTAFRRTGAAGLGACFVLALWRDGAAFGCVLGVLLLCASAMAVALTLTWRPQWLAAIARRGC
ncbi:DUF3325 family protein [Nitrogeniibacter aestuarii]|uniref:DUF3325 family protein n=1 Tax=Nitrogeniibacter aestuarii TaxID=2815343 RepID=UPI001E2A6F51|nr:DUF3325 family protein [Nitrogeniibacter aestuarii]